MCSCCVNLLLLLLCFVSTISRAHNFGEITFNEIIFHSEETPVGYSKFECPKRNNNTDPALIYVFLHMESIRDITSEATLDFYLVQSWSDDRIGQFSEEIKITGRILPDNVWYPDTYFLLVRDTLYSDEEQYFILNKNYLNTPMRQKIEFNRKVRLKTPCTPEVSLFPFDVVKCSLVLTSFGYVNTEVLYAWDSKLGGVLVDPKNNDVNHLGFYVIDKNLKNYTLNYGNANYSALEAQILLKRKYTAYLLQIYAPSALIVILSWSIFWVNINATPARASLGVTTVLTMLTLATQSTSQNAKHVSGKLTALDAYIWACFVFVILAMLEFALSDYSTHTRKAREERKKARQKFLEEEQSFLMMELTPGKTDGVSGGSPSHGRPSEVCNGSPRAPDQPLQPSPYSHMNRINIRRNSENNGFLACCLVMFHGDNVNNLARVFFPVGFFLFNVLYWTVLYFKVTSEEAGSDEIH